MDGAVALQAAGVSAEEAEEAEEAAEAAAAAAAAAAGAAWGIDTVSINTMGIATMFAAKAAIARRSHLERTEYCSTMAGSCTVKPSR